MRKLILASTLASLLLPLVSFAADKPFTGVFHGEGRACYGNLYIRARTMEWTSSFSKCKTNHYEILDQNMSGEHPHISYRISSKQKQCRHEVIALTHYDANVWEVKGYPSLEAYQNRAEAEWNDSMDPRRAVTSCGMTKQ